MKFYLLFLSLLFVFTLTISHVFAQATTKPTESDLRLKRLLAYQKDFSQYSGISSAEGKKAEGLFKDFLTEAVPRSQDCLKNINNEERKKCDKKLKDDYKSAKKFNRLLRYYEIEQGMPYVCIRADLSQGKALEAKGFNPAKASSDNPKETGLTAKKPVYLCTGAKGDKKLRIQDDSGTLLRLSPGDQARTDLKLENIPPAENLLKLKTKLGVIQQ